MIDCVIPIRSGSLGIKNKNIKKINGVPLICNSIEIALKSKIFNRIIIAVDSIKYMKNDELEVVLDNIIDNKDFKENEIIKLMKEFGFDNKINDFIDRFNDYKNIVLSEIK